MPPVDPAADPSSDHADAGRDMSRALGGRLPPPSLAAAWAALAAAPADGQERLRSREDRLLAAPLGLLRWTGEREPSRVRCWEEVEEDGDGEAIAALPFLVNEFMVLYLENLQQNESLFSNDKQKKRELHAVWFIRDTAKWRLLLSLKILEILTISVPYLSLILC